MEGLLTAQRPSEAVARAAREQPYVKLASNLHGYCFYMTGFSTYFGGAWPERPVSAANKSGNQHAHREAVTGHPRTL